MGLLFKDELLDEFGSWPIAYIPYGGVDFGEIAAVAEAVGDGDGSAFHQAWAGTMKGRAEMIRCPTLIMAAENDALAIGAQTLFDALKCPKALIKFTAAEGAGGHCEMMNRSLANRTVLDWLDETLGAFASGL